MEIRWPIDQYSAHTLYSHVQSHIERLWSALPRRFCLTDSLKDFKGTSFERDFVLGVRLKYLHLRFMLRLALLESLTEPDVEILEVAEQMLSLVVEAILSRENLVNSGSSIIWKASTCFGSDAVGVLV